MAEKKKELQLLRYAELFDDKLYERIKPIYSEFKIARIDLEDGNWLRQLSYEDKNGQMLDVKSLMQEAMETA